MHRIAVVAVDALAVDDAQMECRSGRNGLIILDVDDFSSLLRNDQIDRTIPVVVHGRDAGDADKTGLQRGRTPTGTLVDVGEQSRGLSRTVAAELDDVLLAIMIPVDRH